MRLRKIIDWLAWLAVGVAVTWLALSSFTGLFISQKSFVFTGPFQKESAASESHALLIDLRSNLKVSSLISTGGDSANNPYGSTIRVLVNGLELSSPHSLHDDIREKGEGRFSHWHDHLIFSLPTGIVNSDVSQVQVKGVLSNLRLKFIGEALLLGLIGGGILLVGLHRREPALVQQRLAMSSLLIARAILGIAVIWLLASLFFLGSTLAGWWSGYLLPNTAFFRWWPELNGLAKYEPGFGQVLLMISMTGLLAAWMAKFSGDQADAFASVERALESGFRRFGLFVVLGLYLYSVGATWSGIPRPQDLSGSAIAGLVPFSDARGHFLGPYVQAWTGEWSGWVLRRPLAAVFRSFCLVLVNYNNYSFLMLQVTGLAIATFFAIKALISWRGIWAGLTFFGLVFCQVRGYLPTHLTEPLGVFWALIAVPFLVRAIQFNRSGDAIAGFYLTLWALMIRMGAMFTIPALGLWAVISQLGHRRKMAVAALWVSGLFLMVVGISSVVLKFYGAPGSQVGSNFSYVICGLTHGTDWSGCGRIYAEELSFLQSEPEKVAWLYSKAKETFLTDPQILALRLIDGARYFISGLPRFMIAGYGGVMHPLFPKKIWLLVFATGFGWVMWRRREKREIAFWILVVGSIFASAPFVIFDDGWRVMISSFVLVSLFLSCGFASPLHQYVGTPSRFPTNTSKAGISLYRCAPLALVTVLIVPVPILAYNYDLIGRRDFPQIEISEGERLILGGKEKMAGFLVIPDGQSLPGKFPAIRESDFVQIVRNSGIERYQALTTPRLMYDPPFGFVAATTISQFGGIIYITPPEVFTSIDSKPWIFKIEEKENTDFFKKVLHATPIH